MLKILISSLGWSLNFTIFYETQDWSFGLIRRDRYVLGSNIWFEAQIKNATIRTLVLLGINIMLAKINICYLIVWNNWIGLILSFGNINFIYTFTLLGRVCSSHLCQSSSHIGCWSSIHESSWVVWGDNFAGRRQRRFLESWGITWSDEGHLTYAVNFWLNLLMHILVILTIE